MTAHIAVFIFAPMALGLLTCGIVLLVLLLVLPTTRRSLR